MADSWLSSVVESSSVEEYAELTSGIWNLEFIQLAAGRFQYRTQLIAMPRVTIYRECCNTPLHIRGEIRRGCVAFALPAQGSPSCRLWGSYPDGAKILPYITAGGELDAVTGASYRNTVVVIAVDFLVEAARCYNYDFEFPGKVSDGFLVADPRQLHRLRQLVSRVLTLSSGRLATLSSDLEPEEVEIAHVLLAAVSPPQILHRETTLTPMRCAQIVRDCIEFSRVRGYDLSVTELSAMTRTSRRSIERAFREHMGVSPTRYLRLCRYRRALSVLATTSGGRSSVSEVAMMAGFSELGRFAAEYRKLFGEKPSETLSRSLSGVPQIPVPRAAIL